MNRLTITLFVCMCVALMTLATSVSAQDTIHEIHAVQTQPQSSGILERIMNDYVYPLRDYDWRGMVRRFLNGVMDYVSPDAKEPKSDFNDSPYKQAQYRTSILNQHNPQEISFYSDEDFARPIGLTVAKWVIEKASSRLSGYFTDETSEGEDTPDLPNQGHSEASATQKSDAGELQLEKAGHSITKRSPANPKSSNSAQAKVPSDSKALTLNENITPSLATYSWSYLGTLVAYSIFSILGALIPLYKLPSEKPEVTMQLAPELNIPQQNFNQRNNFQNTVQY